VSSLPTRIGLAAGTSIVALIVLGTASWFLGDALLLLLEAEGSSPAAAAGLTGLAGLVLAGLTGLLVRWLVQPHPRATIPAATPAPGANGSAVNGYAAELGALVAQQIATSTRAHPYTTMGAALAAGVALGAVPELRKVITGLVKH
jgi:hypothetical protein